MQSRFAIVLMSIAGAAVLFGIGFALGLGVLSSPAPERHKQIAVTTQPTKVARHEATGSGKHEDNGRALTPLYPVAPGGSADQNKGEKSEQATTKAVPPQQPQQQAKTPAEEPQKEAEKAPARTQAAKADAGPPASTPKDATPVSLNHRNACDIDACSRAYRSFRDSDCTYQPYSGPRQLCVNPPGAREASRSHDEQRPALRSYRRDVTADGEDGRIVVVPADEGDVVGADGYDDDQ